MTTDLFSMRNPQFTVPPGHSRFGCSTRTVVDRDKRMEHLLAFRETLIEFRDPANGKRDNGEYSCSY